MELLIAVLIAFGVVSSGDAAKLSQDEKTVYELIDQNNISQAQIDEVEASIIGLEETDF